MATRRVLIVTDALGIGDHEMSDVLIFVTDDGVSILPYENATDIRLSFSREDWEDVIEFVNGNWGPGGSPPTA